MIDGGAGVYYLGMVVLCEGMILLLSTHLFREHVMPLADRLLAVENVEEEASALFRSCPSFHLKTQASSEGVAMQELRRARNMAVARFCASSGGAALIPLLPGMFFLA
jgi:hypothetical protein